MKTFKTPKGTELPLTQLQGKDYLLVPHRVQWFREEHPDWSIITTFLKLEAAFAISKAEIINNDGKLVATAHKREDQKSFNDYAEKAETGAIGRALALCGYGTQFATELTEHHDRPADAPLMAKAAPGPVIAKKGPFKTVGDIERAAKAQVEQDDWTKGLSFEEPLDPLVPAETTPSDIEEAKRQFSAYVVHPKFKKHANKHLLDIPLHDIEGYVAWLEKQARDKNEKLSREAEELKEMVQIYALLTETNNLPTADEIPF